MKLYITPEAYAALSEQDQDWYSPEYLQYKIKKVRSYESCDLGYEHFMGWVEETTPTGEPCRYSKVDAFTYNMRVMQRLMKPAIIDNLEHANVLMNRALSKPETWEKLQNNGVVK